MEGWGREEGVGEGGRLERPNSKGRICILFTSQGFSIFRIGLHTPGCRDLAVYNWHLSLYLHLASTGKSTNSSRSPSEDLGGWGPLVWVGELAADGQIQFPAFSCAVLFHERNKTQDQAARIPKL